MTESIETLNAMALIEVIGTFRSALDRHQATINRLNVFPVPDGDTGTNMLLTVESVEKALAVIGSSPSMSEVCEAISKGSLMGARGNSGVILCQILRGVANAAKGTEELDGALVASALADGSAAAHAAVLKPAEGTILTVAREGAEAATASAKSGGSLSDVVVAGRKGALESLFRTPELLAVLAAAGVVDAGGAGLVCLYDALIAVVTKTAMPKALSLPPDVAARVAKGAPAGELLFVHEEKDAPSELRYEVMYLLDAPDDAMASFKQAWAGIGDSIVVVGGDGLHNCHIHTNDIGAAIEAALDVGRPREIRVTDLSEQVEEERWVRDVAGQGHDVTERSGPVPVTSVVTVGTGEGIRRVFRSLGVDHMVFGGQSMNPSTEELLSMIDAAPGAEVVVMPNNTNIYPVAAQAAELSKKPVYVIATAGVQEGFAALLDYDPQATAEQNAKAMTIGASRVVCGEITQAVRATSTAAGEVKDGDYIGLSRTGIETIAPNLVDATTKLLEKLISDNHEIVTLIEGSGVTPAELRAVTEWMSEHFEGVSVELIRGDQPLYPFLISIE